MMTKLRATRGHSHPASTARSSKSMPDERYAFNSGVFETHLQKETVPNIASRSTSAHYRCYALKCSTWLVIRSGRQSIQFKKTCDCRIFPIEMILDKYFLNQNTQRAFHQSETKRVIVTARRLGALSVHSYLCAEMHAGLFRKQKFATRRRWNRTTELLDSYRFEVCTPHQ